MPYIYPNLLLRSRIIQAIRVFFTSKGFLEVETPFRIPANAPEDHIQPVLSDTFFLHTSPEICMKRLLCRGHRQIFQISRCWRNGERGRRHLPEFTLLEWYRADADYCSLMNDCSELLANIANTCSDSADFYACTQAIRKPVIMTVREAFSQYAGVDVADAVCEGTFDEILVTRVEPSLPTDIPCILMDYPQEMAALARCKPNDGRYAERFELYLGGMEIANGFSELNDPLEQRRRFVEVNSRRIARGMPPLPLPEPFLKELENMPASAGIAMGIDRLVMYFAGAQEIDEVVAFTPENL